MPADAEKGKYMSPDGSRIWEFLALWTCACIIMCGGYIMGWNSPSIVKLMAPDSPIPITASEASTLVVIFFVGMIGSLINIFIVDRIGRKNALLLSIVPQTISWILIITATNIWMLYAARFLAGLFMNMIVCIYPLYVGEIMLPRSRGVGVAVNVIAYNTGTLTMFIVQQYLSIAISASIFLAVSIVFASIFWFMPETPYFLVMKDRMEEAEETLMKLRGKMNVSEEMAVIVESIKSKENKKFSLSVDGMKVLFTRANRRAFAIIILISLAQYISGSFIIIAYCQLIFISTTNAISDRMVAITIGTMQLISAFVTFTVIDKLGRKPLLITTGMIAAFGNFAIGSFFYAKEYLDVDVSAYSWVLVVAMLVVVFFINCGPLSLAKVMAAEIFASEIKAFGTSSVMILNGCISITMAKVYIVVAITWNYGHSPLFLVFSIATALCTVLCYCLMPETKGKTFVQIQKELSS